MQCAKVTRMSNYMVLLAQLVRAHDCGSRGRQFDSDITPLVSYRHNINFKINFQFVSLFIIH